MLTPAKIFKLWKRVNDRFGLVEDDPKARDKGDNKKPSAKARQAEKEDKRVTKRLTELRVLGRGNLAEPAPAKKFLKGRDKAAKAMKKYCKLLKSNDLKEAVQDLIKFRKAVKQLVIVVELLDARPYPEEGEGEADLNALDKVDTSALDRAMEDPNFGEYSDAELDQDEVEAEEGGPTPVPSGKAPPPPPDNRPLLFKQKLQQLMPVYQPAMRAGVPNRGALELAMKLATAAATAKDFEQGLVQLGKVEAELKKAAPAAAPTPARPRAAGADPAAEWKAKLAQWTPDIKAAMAAKGPNAAAIAKLLAQATALSKPGGDMVLALAKLTECHDLSAPASRGPADDAAPAKERGQAEQVPAGLVKYRTALLNYRAARATVIDQLESLHGAVAAALPEEADMAVQLIERLDETLTELDDAIDDAINAAKDERDPYDKATRDLIRTCLGELGSDPLIRHVDNNPFVTVRVAATLGAALTAIENTMV